MEENIFPVAQFQNVRTPFYYYDTTLLDETLQAIKGQTDLHEGYHLHYAVKACANPKVLRHIVAAGFGADCVSGGEIQACLDAGFPAREIVFAGVGKSDWEIELGLRAGIQYFNVESIPELEVINQIAGNMGRKANVSFRINPNVGAHTHAHITTGLAENKFGIAMEDMERVIALADTLPHVEFVGLHFHIGSQILEMDDFVSLSKRVNELQDRLESQGIQVKNINVGGGLGIDYQHPSDHPVPDFKSYFDTYAAHLKLRPGQHLHFELGRAVVGQCGSLITRCLYVKQGACKQFAIVDGGMSDLIRPALYGAFHYIENLTADASRGEEVYDVVGPICESSDVFAKAYRMPVVRRGDLLALRSAGAYGEIMSCGYNCRPLPVGYVTEDFQ